MRCLRIVYQQWLAVNGRAQGNYSLPFTGDKVRTGHGQLYRQQHPRTEIGRLEAQAGHLNILFLFPLPTGVSHCLQKLGHSQS